MTERGLFRAWFKKKSAPRVVMTLLARDDADIVGDMIEFHLNSGVDLILALDNGSVDGTTDILKEFEKTGRLEYRYEPSDEWLQDVWTTSLAQRASAVYHAEWIINGDDDEFFIPEGGSLKAVLERIPPEVGAVSVKRNDMVPIVRPQQSSPISEMVYRKRLSLEWVKGHPIVDKIIHRGFRDVKVSRGSHVIKSESLKQTIPCPDIITFHYPIRSWDQFSRKVKQAGIALTKTRFPIARYEYWYAALLEGRLEKVYAEYELNTVQLHEKLATGEIVEDRRLADFLGELRKSGRVRRR